MARELEMEQRERRHELDEHTTTARRHAEEAASTSEELAKWRTQAHEAVARAEAAEVEAAAAKKAAARSEDVSQTMLLSTQQEGIAAMGAAVRGPILCYPTPGP